LRRTALVEEQEPDADACRLKEGRKHRIAAEGAEIESLRNDSKG
jgi:hypothetical protein